MGGVIHHARPTIFFEPTLRSMRYLLANNSFDILEHYTYSRKDPVSNGSAFSKIMNRWLKKGTNLAFITRPV